MSEEDSNNSGEEENEEEEEKEEEENEEEENEENENEENEEGEGNEEEDEEEDDDDDKKKKGKKKNDKKDDKKETQKFEKEKLVQTNEIKIDLNNNPGVLTTDQITMSNFPIERPPPSIFEILSDINNQMDTLSTKLNSTLSFIESRNPKSLDQEDEELKQLINKATQLTKDIGPPKLENKAIQSDDEEEVNNFNTEPNQINPIQSVSPYDQYGQPKYNQNRPTLPYDPNKNRQYYSSLNNRGFNDSLDRRPPQNFTQNKFQTSRVKRMDDLYQRNLFGNRMPIVYSQNDGGMNQSMRGRMINNELAGSLSSSRKNDFQRNDFQRNDFQRNDFQRNDPMSFGNNQEQPKPFERFRPKNISQAMDILLDKQ